MLQKGRSRGHSSADHDLNIQFTVLLIREDHSNLSSHSLTDLLDLEFSCFEVGNQTSSCQQHLRAAFSIQSCSSICSFDVRCCRLFQLALIWIVGYKQIAIPQVYSCVQHVGYVIDYIEIITSLRNIALSPRLRLGCLPFICFRLHLLARE